MPWMPAVLGRETTHRWAGLAGPRGSGAIFIAARKADRGADPATRPAVSRAGGTSSHSAVLI